MQYGIVCSAQCLPTARAAEPPPHPWEFRAARRRLRARDLKKLPLRPRLHLTYSFNKASSSKSCFDHRLFYELISWIVRHILQVWFRDKADNLCPWIGGQEHGVIWGLAYLWSISVWTKSQKHDNKWRLHNKSETLNFYDPNRHPRWGTSEWNLDECTVCCVYCV